MSDNVKTGPDLQTYQQWAAERKATLPPVRSEALTNLQLAVYRELGRLGWDKTASGWRNVRIGEVKTMDAALQQEIDAANAPADGREE